MTFTCVRCLCDGRHGVPAVALDGVNSVCLEHLVAAWRTEQNLPPLPTEQR